MVFKKHKGVISLIYVLVLIVGCSKNSEENAALKVAIAFNAEKYNLEKKKKNDFNSIVLTLNFHTLNKDYNKKKITSTSALIFFQDVDRKEFNDSDSITIVVKAPAIEYKRGYAGGEIKDADTLIKEVVKFINSFQCDDYSYIYKMVDSSKISDSNLKETKRMFSSLDYTYGKITNITTTGFSYNQSADTEEPVLVLWMELNNNKNIRFCTFYISMINRKIIYYKIDSKDDQ